MFEWLFKKRDDKVAEETRKAFSGVKKDMEHVGKWIKHLDETDRNIIDNLKEIREEISNIRDEIDGLREAIHDVAEGQKDQQVFDRLPVVNRQAAVLPVERVEQTTVQTANLFNILKNMSANERLVIFTLMNSELKLSYEDLALLLGKEKSTIRGQVNTIRQKCIGIIEEISEKNGKKRVYIPDEVKEKLAKYGKVRVKKKEKVRVNNESSD